MNKDFEKQIHIILNKSFNDCLTAEDLFNIKSFTVSQSTLSGEFKSFDLNNLKYLKGLEQLSLFDCDVFDINFLLELNNLKELKFSNCSIKTLNGINDLSNLKHLTISECYYDSYFELKDLDLKGLVIKKASMNNLDFLNNMNLEYLELTNVKVNNYEGLKVNNNIKILNLTLTSINNLEFLYHFKYLQNLIISDDSYINNKVVIDNIIKLGVIVSNEYLIRLGGDSNEPIS